MKEQDSETGNAAVARLLFFYYMLPYAQLHYKIVSQSDLHLWIWNWFTRLRDDVSESAPKTNDTSWFASLLNEKQTERKKTGSSARLFSIDVKSVVFI